MSASSTSIQLRGPAFAVAANNSVCNLPEDDRYGYVVSVARAVLKSVTDAERADVYVIAAYDLCETATQNGRDSDQLRSLCNIVAARMLLRGRVAADCYQKMGMLDAGSAWMLLGASPLCPDVRDIVVTPHPAVTKLLTDFNLAHDTDAEAVPLHELTAAIGRIINIIVDAEPLFHPPVAESAAKQ